ncbi:MAG TPA: hypothetical protein VKX29_05820 [Brumimicrobium sp.]|nr:hypothetical protein [Brumimicrobium sp.]
MYRLLLLFVILSVFARTQEAPKVNNQSNSLEPAVKKEIKAETDAFVPMEQTVQMKLFTSNVQEIQAELNAISISSTRKSPTQLELQKMQSDLEVLKVVNSKSFEYNLLNYQVGNYDFSRIESLKAAERLQPNHAIVLKELSAYSYIKNDVVSLKKYLNKLSSQQFFSKDLQLYAESTLLSLPVNSVLVTHGDQDTYPLLIQQKLKNTRLDLEIISLDHLQSDDYRKRMKMNGFLFPESDYIDVQFFKAFMHLNRNKNIVVASSVPRSYLSNVDGDMKTVGIGIAFQGFDQYGDKENVKLYEKTMKLLIEQHIQISKDKGLLGNYLPFLFSVRNNYISNNELDKITEIESVILQIAELSNKYQQVNTLLSK